VISIAAVIDVSAFRMFLTLLTDRTRRRGMQSFTCSKRIVCFVAG
jgi:hypothetical protein